MKSRLIILATLLTIGVTVSYAQPVHIPDSNLRHAIASKLGIPQEIEITQGDMQRLIEFHVDEQGVRVFDEQTDVRLVQNAKCGFLRVVVFDRRRIAGFV